MLATCLTLALALAADPPPDGMVRATYPLSAVLPPSEPSWTGISTTPFRTGRVYGSPEPELDARRITADRVIDLVRRAVSPSEWEQPGRSINLTRNGSALSVAAPDAVQQDVRRCLAFLASHLRREIRVTVEAWSVRGRDDSLGALARDPNPRARIDALAKSGRLSPVRRTTLRMISGIPTASAQVREKSFLADYEIEIAQSAAIHDPIVEVCTLGFSLVARADRTPRGDVLLHFAARNAEELRAPRRIETAASILITTTDRVTDQVREPGFVESPNVAFQTLAGSTLLAVGVPRFAFVGALEAGPDDGLGLLLSFQLESLETVEPVFKCGDRELAVKDVASATGAALQVSPVDPRQASLSNLRSGDEPQDGIGAPAIVVSAGQLEGGGDAALDGLGDLEDDLTLEYERGFLIAVGPAGQAGATVERAAAGLASPDAGAALAFARASGDDSASRSLVFLVPAAAGEALAFCGMQETLLVDADVDVANHVGAANAWTMPFMNGRFFSMTTSGATGDGAGPQLDLALVARHRYGERAVIEHESHYASTFDRIQVASSRWHENLRFSAQGGAQRVLQALTNVTGTDGVSSLDLEVEMIAP